MNSASTINYVTIIFNKTCFGVKIKIRNEINMRLQRVTVVCQAWLEEQWEVLPLER